MDEQRMKKWLGRPSSGGTSPSKRAIRSLGSSASLVQFSAVKYGDSSSAPVSTPTPRSRANSLPAKVSGLYRRNSSKYARYSNDYTTAQPVPSSSSRSSPGPVENHQNYNSAAPSPYTESIIPPLPTGGIPSVEPASTPSHLRQDDTVDKLATSILHVISDTDVEWVM